MPVIYLVLSKGKELEAEFTSKKEAVEYLHEKDFYMGCVESYEVDQDYYDELKDFEDSVQDNEPYGA